MLRRSTKTRLRCKGRASLSVRQRTVRRLVYLPSSLNSRGSHLSPSLSIYYTPSISLDSRDFHVSNDAGFPLIGPSLLQICG
ncbi:hypothetical protein ACLOJK_017194 [Asimina triloba]